MGNNIKKRTKPSPTDGSGEGGDGKRRRKRKRIKISEIFQTLLSNNIGRTLDELKHDFTIDQIYLFYEKCLKAEFERQRFTAVSMAKALYCTSPSHSKVQSNEKGRAWDKFMDSLDWDKISKPKEKADPETLKMAFGWLGVSSTKSVSTKKGDK